MHLQYVFLKVQKRQIHFASFISESAHMRKTKTASRVYTPLITLDCCTNYQVSLVVKI